MTTSSEESPKILLFALSTCSHCKAVKRLLDSRGIEYEKIEVDLLQGEDRKQAIENVKRHNDRVTFPTTVIGETVVVGDKKEKIENALDRLGHESGRGSSHDE